MSGLWSFSNGSLRMFRKFCAYVSRGTYQLVQERFERYVLRGSFDCRIVCAEEEHEEFNFGDSLRHRLRNDLWEKDFCMFCC